MPLVAVYAALVTVHDGGNRDRPAPSQRSPWAAAKRLRGSSARLPFTARYEQYLVLKPERQVSSSVHRGKRVIRWWVSELEINTLSQFP